MSLPSEPFEVSEARIKHGDSSWSGISKEPAFILTLEQARALYRELEKSYINQENPLAVAVVMDLGKFIDRFSK